MAGQENDRFRISTRRELMLQVKTACARHAHVKNETARPVRYARLKQISGRGETRRLHSGREYEFVNSFSNGSVIIDDLIRSWLPEAQRREV